VASWRGAPFARPRVGPRRPLGLEGSCQIFSGPCAAIRVQLERGRHRCYLLPAFGLRLGRLVAGHSKRHGVGGILEPAQLQDGPSPSRALALPKGPHWGGLDVVIVGRARELGGGIRISRACRAADRVLGMGRIGPILGGRLAMGGAWQLSASLARRRSGLSCGLSRVLSKGWMAKYDGNTRRNLARPGAGHRRQGPRNGRGHANLQERN